MFEQASNFGLQALSSLAT